MPMPWHSLFTRRLGFPFMKGNLCGIQVALTEWDMLYWGRVMKIQSWNPFLLVFLQWMDSSKNRSNKSLYYEQLAVTHHAWRPVNLNVRDHRQFHIPRVLFTHLMKNLGVPEIFAREFLHICQNFRGICKSIKNDIFGLENNLYLHYSHKGVIVRVEETIFKLQNWPTCKNFRGTFPCNFSKYAVFHT